MSADKIVDRAVELLVYAPVGLVASARDLLPAVIERGRRQVDGQVAVARVVGQFAVRQGQVQAGRAVELARAQAAEALEGLAGKAEEAAAASRPAPAPSSPAASPPAASSPAAPAPAPGAAPRPAGTDPVVPAVATRRVDADERPAAPDAAPSAEHLAIPGYDALSASQVVPRLGGLSPAELEQVRGYEEATRGRKTILGKIAQLQAS